MEDQDLVESEEEELKEESQEDNKENLEIEANINVDNDKQKGRANIKDWTKSKLVKEVIER